MKIARENAIEILRQIRYEFKYQGVSFVVAFRAMDKNKDGFLCIDEWSTGIDKYLQLSDEAKQGFFNFMDKTNIGIIDSK